LGRRGGVREELVDDAIDGIPGNHIKEVVNSVNVTEVQIGGAE
jgi:hypothetical protein